MRLFLASFVIVLSATERAVTILEDYDHINSYHSEGEYMRYDEIPLTEAAQLRSSTGREPDRAIDGDPLSYSEGVKVLSYSAYLKAVFPMSLVRRVIIHSVAGKSKKFRNFEICIKNAGSRIECRSFNQKVSRKGDMFTFSGNNYGSEIFIYQKDSRHLELPIAEVRIFGNLRWEQVPLFAPNMVGTTTDTANNGLTHNRWSHFTTDSTADAWWEADFGTLRHINKIYILTYLPEASSLSTFNIVLSRSPITSYSSRTDDYNTKVIREVANLLSPSGGVYPNQGNGFTARYIRIEKDSIYEVPLSLTNVQVFASTNQGKHNQNWGFTTTGCAKLNKRAENLQNHIVNCGTDKSGLISGFAMREHSDCYPNEYKMESYCTNAKVINTCTTLQTSCMNLKSGLHRITQSVDCSSIGGIKDWRVVTSGCSSSQRRISYTCCPLPSVGSSRVESTSCVKVKGQDASVFRMYRTHCLENEVMSKWEFIGGCSDEKFRRIAYTCTEISSVVIPRVRAEGIEHVSHMHVGWRDIINDISLECDGSTVGLCFTQHWYEMEFSDFEGSRITRGSGGMTWERSDRVAKEVPFCRYFKIATLDKFTSNAGKNAWLLGHDCGSDGGVRMISITSDGMVSYESNSYPLRHPIYLWSSNEVSIDFKICSVFIVTASLTGDCDNDLYSCKANSFSFTQSTVNRITTSSSGTISGTSPVDYSVIRFRKVLLEDYNNVV